MADRTSAHVFAEMLKIVLEPNPDETPRDVAIRILHLSKDYDFRPGQMDIDELLAKHNLVRQWWHPRWKCLANIYAHEDGFDEDGFDEATQISADEE